MDFPEVTLRLPGWVREVLPDPERRYCSDEERMRLVIELSRLNVVHGTGGPFGAAVFDLPTGRLLAPGVNLVVGSRCSAAHAEVVALMVAQRAVGHYDLGHAGMPARVLVASTEPCAMCFGAVPWSGVRRLVCGARDEDARAVGFDEGPKVADWAAALEVRGIEVARDVCREEAVAVLRRYQQSGGEVYGGRQGDPG